jgi:hypothetical protein
MTTYAVIHRYAEGSSNKRFLPTENEARKVALELARDNGMSVYKLKEQCDQICFIVRETYKRS